MKTLLLTAFALIFVVSTANAQQTFFKVRIDNVAEAFTYPSSGVFNTPEGATDPAAIGPGGVRESFPRTPMRRGPNTSPLLFDAKRNVLWRAPR